MYEESIRTPLPARWAERYKLIYFYDLDKWELYDLGTPRNCTASTVTPTMPIPCRS